MFTGEIVVDVGDGEGGVGGERLVLGEGEDGYGDGD